MSSLFIIVISSSERERERDREREREREREKYRVIHLSKHVLFLDDALFAYEITLM